MSENNILEQSESAARGCAPVTGSAKPSRAERERRRNIIGGIYVESDSCSDNVAIALMCYFTHHMDNPADGQEDEYGNDLWASKKTEEALERIADSVWPNDPKLSHGANNRKREFAAKCKIKEQPPLAPARC